VIRTIKWSSVVFLCLTGLALSAQAASSGSITLVGASNVDNICTHGSVDFDYSVIPDHVDEVIGGGEEVDWVGFNLTDARGVPINTSVAFYVVSTTPVSDSGTRYNLGVYGGAINDITARPIYARLYDIPPMYLPPGSFEQDQYDFIESHGTLLAEYSYDPATFIDDCGTLPLVVPGDDTDSPPTKPSSPPRPGIDTLNANALIVPVLDRPDLSPDMGLVIWGINPVGEGYLAFVVPSDVLAKLPDHPDEAILIDSTDDGLYAFYKLTTGEYQLNIGPDFEGKVQVVIFDGIPPTTVYRRDFNIYDILNGG
jgi:hypothetical protein